MKPHYADDLTQLSAYVAAAVHDYQHVVRALRATPCCTVLMHVLCHAVLSMLCPCGCWALPSGTCGHMPGFLSSGTPFAIRQLLPSTATLAALTNAFLVQTSQCQTQYTQMLPTIN